MKRHLFFSVILIILSAGCAQIFYQGYPDELYQTSSRGSSKANTPDNRYIYSGSNETNVQTVDNSDISNSTPSGFRNQETRNYLSIAIGTPVMYSVFASPFYYDWWYFPYYGSFWYMNNPWYWDPFWDPYWEPIYFHQYYAWYYPRWYHYYWWYNDFWWYRPVNYPVREHLSHRPEMGNYRQSLRFSINASQSMGSKISGSNSPSWESPRPRISNNTTPGRQSLTNSNSGSGSIATGTGTTKPEVNTNPERHGSLSTSRPMMPESYSDKPSGRVTHTRDLQTGSGSITKPIHTNNRIDLPSESGNGNIRNNRVNPNQNHDLKPSGQGGISPNATGNPNPNRGTGSGTISRPSDNREKRNTDRTITTQPYHQPSNQKEPSRYESPSGTSSPINHSTQPNRGSMRTNGGIKEKH
ncbi:MAG TPA: hypothetical protein PK990_00815 [Salinivirgaceae bacterium]|nr:hypothetical protein [Salinivirgaceae bacterium]